MCVYVVVLVGCCCICGGPHLTRLSLRAAAWDSRNPLQFANELSVKAHAGGRAQIRLSRPPLSWAVCPHRMCEARARAFAIFMVGLLHAAQGEEATAREQPFQQPNVKRTFYQRSVLPSPAGTCRRHSGHCPTTSACEACRPKAASLTVHIGPAHLLASGCWPKLIGNWRPFHLTCTPKNCVFSY